MSPTRYDFPARVRTPGAAARETSRIQQSLIVAKLRGDQGAVRYLIGRLGRAEAASKAVRRAAEEDDLADARDVARFADLRLKRAARHAQTGTR